MHSRKLISRLLVLAVWAFSRLFYRHRVEWVGLPPDNWQDLRVFAFLNHTSLLEPLFAGAFAPGFLWRFAARATMPGADITMERPLVGRFYRLLSPRTVAITRRRDDSWQAFLEQIPTDALVTLAPEGRMMRANGLDKDGRPMSMRGGIADILRRVGTGKMLIAYSGGLHHVNLPGQARVRLFQTLHLRLEVLDIHDYLAGFGPLPDSELRLRVARDLDARLARHRP